MSPLLPDEQRVMPCTGSHEEVASHKLLCNCTHCSAYPRPLMRQIRNKAIR